MSPLMKLSPLPFTPSTRYHLATSLTSLQRYDALLTTSCPTGMNMTSSKERRASITLQNQSQDDSPSFPMMSCPMSSTIALSPTPYPSKSTVLLITSTTKVSAMTSSG